MNRVKVITFASNKFVFKLIR